MKRNAPTLFSPRFATFVALSGLLLFLVLLYDKLFGSLIPSFLNPLFSHPYVFVACYLVCLALLGVAIIQGKFRILTKACLVAGVVVALAFPWLLPTIYGEYRPYAQAASGYEMQWVTKPGNSIDSAFKSALREHESSGCTYTLYGWSTDNVLYYGSDCQPGFWRYDPQKDARPEWAASLSSEFKTTSSVNVIETAAGGNMASEPEPPKGFDPMAEYPVHVYQSSISADGEWVAAVISDFYGPYDVVVLHPKS